MTAQQLIDKLSKFPPDLRVFQYNKYVDDSDTFNEVRHVREGYFSLDSEELYFDIDDAIEEEHEDWGGELEEVIVIRT